MPVSSVEAMIRIDCFSDIPLVKLFNLTSESGESWLLSKLKYKVNDCSSFTVDLTLSEKTEEVDGEADNDSVSYVLGTEAVEVLEGKR